MDKILAVLALAALIALTPACGVLREVKKLGDEEMKRQPITMTCDVKCYRNYRN